MSDDAGPSEPLAPKMKRKMKGGGVDAGALVEGMLHVIRTTLSTVLNPEQVDKAMATAQKGPPYKRMMSAVAAAGKGGGKRGIANGGGSGAAAGGPKAVRSTYQAFTTVAMAHLKAAERTELTSMTIVGNTWKRLPANVRARIEDRLNALKDRYNAALSRGEAVGPLAEELKKYDDESGADPLDFTSFIIKYKDAPLQQQAGDTTPAKAAVPKAAPAAAATGDKRRAEGEEHSHKKKEKKHKKDKKDKKHHDDE